MRRRIDVDTTLFRRYLAAGTYLSYFVILQAELRKKLESEDVPKYFGFIDTAIGKFGKDGYAVPSGVSFIT